MSVHGRRGGGGGGGTTATGWRGSGGIGAAAAGGGGGGAVAVRPAVPARRRRPDRSILSASTHGAVPQIDERTASADSARGPAVLRLRESGCVCAPPRAGDSSRQKTLKFGARILVLTHFLTATTW